MSRASTPFGLLESVATRVHRVRLLATANPVQRRAARWRLGSWIVVAGVGLLVHHQLQAADQVRDDWGTTRPVVVVTRPVPAGEPVIGALRVERFPARTVPDGALDRPPTGGRATVALSVGQVVTDALVDRADRGAVAGALPDGTVGVSVSTGTLQPPVEPGDRVDVVVARVGGQALDLRTSAVDAGGVDPEPVARRAVVMRIDGERVTLAVSGDQAARTAAAALVGPVALLLQR